MTFLAPHATAFVTQHLPRDLRASEDTIESYSAGLLMFVLFIAEKRGTRPSRVKAEHISTDLVLEFLDFLEQERGNSIRTRNIRLSTIKSFFRYLESRSVACLNIARQVHAIPQKRFDKTVLDWLDRDEIQSLIDAPDVGTTSGLRDRAMLHLGYSAGLRASELVSLTLDRFQQPDLETVHVLGKGRRERVLPLWKETQVALKSWLDIRPRTGSDRVFLNARGEPMGRHGFAHRLKLHAATACRSLPSIGSKNVTPHVLRRSCAMHTLQATKWNVGYVSLWLGHVNTLSTDIYLQGNSAEKLEVLAANLPPTIKRGSFNRAQDKLVKLLSDPLSKKLC